MANHALINDVANLFRVSPGTIRFYERKNIITPVRDKDNGYRYFTQDDIRRLSSCRIFQSLGFSLNEIADIFQNSSEQDLTTQLAAKKSELEKVIRETTDALECIQRMSDAEDLFETHSSKFYIQNSPRLLFSYHSEKGEVNQSCIKSRFWDLLADNYNLFSCSTVIPTGLALDPHLDTKMKRGYSIEYEEGLKLGLQPDEFIVDLKPRRSAYTVFHAEPIVTCEHLMPIYSWMERCGFKLTGDIICRTIKVTFNRGTDSRYYEVWLPID